MNAMKMKAARFVRFGMVSCAVLVLALGDEARAQSFVPQSTPDYTEGAAYVTQVPADARQKPPPRARAARAQPAQPRPAARRPVTFIANAPDASAASEGAADADKGVVRATIAGGRLPYVGSVASSVLAPGGQGLPSVGAGVVNR